GDSRQAPRTLSPEGRRRRRDPPNRRRHRSGAAHSRRGLRRVRCAPAAPDLWTSGAVHETSARGMLSQCTQPGPWVTPVAWVRAGGELLLPIGSLLRSTDLCRSQFPYYEKKGVVAP